MATDAIQGYLESLKKDGEPIPTDESITEQLLRSAIVSIRSLIPQKQINKS